MSFHQAAFRHLWANDNNHWACNTYRNNFGVDIIEGDVRDIDINSIPDTDIILGGFPCQDFSMIWKRGGVNTDRGNLYQYFVKVVKKKRPALFIAENVKGLLTANKGLAVEKIKSGFRKEGYRVDVHLINFADYGVAQLRERIFIIGVRDDISQEFIFPPPSHTPEEYMGSKEALEGVEKVDFNNEMQNIQPSTIEKLKLIPPGGNYTNIPKSSDHYVKGMISHVYRRLHPDKPSTTIIAAGGGGTWGYHYEHLRSLTNRERARLFGYPDDFIFDGSVTEVRRQIGNSVPPGGTKALAESVKQFLSENL